MYAHGGLRSPPLVAYSRPLGGKVALEAVEAAGQPCGPGICRVRAWWARWTIVVLGPLHLIVGRAAWSGLTLHAGLGQNMVSFYF